MKKKIILSIILFILALLCGTIAYGATYSTDYVSITIPNNYEKSYESVDDDSEYVTYRNSTSTRNVHWDVYTRYFGKTAYTEEDVNKQVTSLKEIYSGSDYSLTILHKGLIENNGILGMRIAYKVTYSSTYTYYYDCYYFLTDNYEVELSFYTTTAIYIDSTEEKAIVNSFKIKDTVLESRGIPFTDVATNAWYYGSVKYVYSNSMILGTNDYTYNPGGELSRGMLVTILWRMEGNPTATKTTKFSDVSSSQYYYKAIQWATQKGIVSGYGNGKFKPNNGITREELAVMLRNYANYKGKNTNSTTSLTSFADYKNVASWSKTAVQWAVKQGIISGSTSNGKTYLKPAGTATRAQTATMIMNYCKNIGK